jgi:hyperosmotically inducible protein
MSRTIFALWAALVLMGCEKKSAAPKTIESAKATDSLQSPDAALTPEQQNEMDLRITQKLREGMAKDNALVGAAKNVTITTVGGIVTLRGPVQDDKEKLGVTLLAARTPGVKRVMDELEVAKSSPK